MPELRYRVVRDTREQEGKGWTFSESKNCLGTVSGTLKTGDYAIEGRESTLCIERKGSVAEFAQNVYQKRFEAELERMASFRFAYVILEFEADAILNWPASSGLPKQAQARTKLTGFAFLRRLHQLEILYPHVRFVFAGDHGRAVAASLMKRVCEAAA